MTDIHDVFCFTSDMRIMSLIPDGVSLLIRDPRLDGDEILANELFSNAVDRVDADIIVLCQAPSPYISAQAIKQGLLSVIENQYDCAFSVKKIQKYCWKNREPINYDPLQIAQTQDLEAVYEETSGFYIFRRDNYIASSSRIHGRKNMVEVSIRESVDIDTPEEFCVAQRLYDPLALQPPKSDSNYYHDLLGRLSLHSFTNLRSIKHIAFDFDGVIIDSLETMSRAWFEATTVCGLTISFEEYKKYLGLDFYDILFQLGIDSSLHAKIKENYIRASFSHIHHTKLYPSTYECLKILHDSGAVLSLVTSKSADLTRNLLQKYELDQFFQTIVTPENVVTRRSKPFPDGLLQAALYSKVSPRDSLYLGDMMVDKEAAESAGYGFVLASWGYGVPSSDDTNTVWFSSLSDFTKYFTSSGPSTY